jgi:hypothetical protein
MNPATALVWGDTELETGQIITFRGVGKKYSGNYYTIKAVHKLDHGSGYNCSLEMATQGSNVKTGKNSMAVKEANKQVNKELGIDRQTERKNKIRRVSNGRR